MRFSYLIAAIVLLAFASNVSSAGSRSLMQSCPIWRCASGCALEDQLTNGVRRWTCAACLPTYRLLTNKRACVCPAGTVETNGNCTRCPLGSYCPAGTGNGVSSAINLGTTVPITAATENITSGFRSFRISCGLNMTTRLTGAKEEISCVTSPGFLFGGPGTNATSCPANTYNPGANRLTACYACPSGLITTSNGSDSKLDCQVPAGYIMNRGVVTPCPKGTYRVGVALPTAQLNCTRCNRGWTTGGVASTLDTQCAFTLPGFTATGGNQAAATATACPVGSWAGERAGNANGGFCIPCGNGWTTKNLTLDTDGLPIGATSQSACANAPGWYTYIANAAQPCLNGTYAAGWARRTSCTPCGTNIMSAPNTTDETDSSQLVAASPNDCYMPAGWGMTFNRSSGLFTAAICPNNTYGSIEVTYGLKFSPCKPCPRGLITSGPGMISKDNCTNPAGWGWNGFTAEICPPGSWAAANTLLSCTACPLNRNTTSITYSTTTTPFTDSVSAMPLPATLGTDMDNYTDCKVIAGYGLMNVTGFMATADIPATVEDRSTADVGECPVGTYSAGGDVGTVCSTCASTTGTTDGALGPYSTTSDSGSSNISDCNLCLAGYGAGANTHSSSATLCSGCLTGFYQVGGSVTCLACGSIQPFTYPGKTETITTTATTKIGNATHPGARSTDECYPAMWQLDESMGTHLVNTSGLFGSPVSVPLGSQTEVATSAQICSDTCAAAANCIGATWIYNDTSSTSASVSTGRCITYLQNPANGHLLYIKVLPMDYMAGAAVGKAAVASGHYVLFRAMSPNLGVSFLGNTTASYDDCSTTCDNNVQCWGFYYISGYCIPRKGLEGEGHRTLMHVIGSRIEP